MYVKQPYFTDDETGHGNAPPPVKPGATPPPGTDSAPPPVKADGLGGA